MEIKIWESCGRKNAGKEKKKMMTSPFSAKMCQNLSPVCVCFFFPVKNILWIMCRFEINQDNILL